MKKAALLLAGVLVVAYFGCNPVVGEDPDFSDKEMVIEGQIDEWKAIWDGVYIYSTFGDRGEWVDSALVDNYGKFALGLSTPPDSITWRERYVVYEDCPDIFVTATDTAYQELDVRFYLAEPDNPGDTAYVSYSPYTLPALIEYTDTTGYTHTIPFSGTFLIYCDRDIDVVAEGDCKIKGRDWEISHNYSLERGFNYIKRAKADMDFANPDTTIRKDAYIDLDRLPPGQYEISGDWK
ncbi:MAG: hypothetical protein GF419_08320 [Ignavibacteriales bacterium]|nr:hypothetical protein [Ignavibacteriales bacterium]